jgi:hypothetical protein
MPRTQQRSDAEQVTNLTEQLGALKMRLREGEERERRFVIDRKVEAIKLPACREFFRSLYAAAMAEGSPRTVSFSENGTAREIPPTAVLDSLAAFINKNVSKLFVELANAGSSSRDGGPLENSDAEVDRLTRAKMKADKLSYSEAMNAVLSDPENAALKEAYARGGGAA